MLRRVVVVAFICCAVRAFAEQRTMQFEVSEEFLRSWAHDPVASLDVRLFCAGPVHNATSDCELHVGAEIADPGISNYQGVVLEPPNICKDPGGKWRSKINALKNEDCTATGFLRAWPEHLHTSQGCSNPAHFLEVHPLLSLSCGETKHDFTSMLRAPKDLGYKTPVVVRKMLGMKLWACRGCGTGAEGVPSIAFDYCFGNPCTRGQASNFARLKVRVLRDTIRPEPGKTLDGFATVVARVNPVGEATSGTMTLLKLYAIAGTDFHTQLLAQRAKTGSVPTWEILGIFAIDPFSVLRTIEASDFKDGAWSLVAHPVTLVVFGRLSPS